MKLPGTALLPVTLVFDAYRVHRQRAAKQISQRVPEQAIVPGMAEVGSKRAASALDKTAVIYYSNLIIYLGQPK